MRMKKKKTFDFTTGPILKNLVLFAIPLIISFTLQNLYNMVDMVVVGRMIGEEAIAAVGTTSGIFMLVTMFISGATVGMSVVVSQYLGAGDMKMVNRSIYTSLYLIMAFTAVTSVLGAVFTRQLLILIRTPENVLADAVIYLRIIFIGEAATAVYNMASQLMRSLGDSLTPMIMLIIASVLNVTLNILFVGPLHMGVAGVAYGTLLASAFAAVSCRLEGAACPSPDEGRHPSLAGSGEDRDQDRDPFFPAVVHDVHRQYLYPDRYQYFRGDLYGCIQCGFKSGFLHFLPAGRAD